jgi:Tfp pilus assembly protein PilO
MPDLRRTRKQIKIALAVLVAVDVVAVVILISPLVGSTASRTAELRQLWTELRTKTTQVQPLDHLDQKVLAANKQIGEFYKKRFPAQDSQIATQLGKLATDSGVTIDQARYKQGDAEVDHLLPVEVDANLSGNYVQLARFVNALERDDMLFIINSIELGGEQRGPIRLQMKLETYLKVGM